MDSLGSLALATEPPNEVLLKRPPYKREEYIISQKMVKHILGNAIYQLVIIYAIVFAGEYWYPEPNAQYRSPHGDYVYSGRPYDWDNSELYLLKRPEWGYSRHYTNVFNVFVWLQVFNMIGSRKIHDEINMFAGITTNWIFFVIMFIISGAQILIVMVGGTAFKVTGTKPAIEGI